MMDKKGLYNTQEQILKVYNNPSKLIKPLYHKLQLQLQIKQIKSYLK